VRVVPSKRCLQYCSRYSQYEAQERVADPTQVCIPNLEIFTVCQFQNCPAHLAVHVVSIGNSFRFLPTNSKSVFKSVMEVFVQTGILPCDKTSVPQADRCGLFAAFFGPASS